MGFKKKTNNNNYGDSIIDVVDTVDSSFKDYEVAWIKFRRGKLVTMSKGESVPIMVRRVLAKADSSIKHLRFHGHGYPGCQGIAMGNKRSSNPYDCISSKNFDIVSPMLKLLGEKLSSGAKVDLLGCNVAQGQEGSALLTKLAKLWGVPITAGINTQFAASPKVDLSRASENVSLTHEGPTKTFYP